MKESKEVIKLFKEFESKFGFKTYEKLKEYFYTLLRKIEDLEKSRDNWKNKYNNLKNDIKNR